MKAIVLYLLVASVLGIVAFVIFIERTEQQARAQTQGNFLKLVIEETKSGSEINYSVKSAKLIWLEGDCSTLYQVHGAPGGRFDEYSVLETYTKKNGEYKLLAKYSLPSGRIVLWDGPNGGGMQELDSGTILETIPYGSDNPIVAVRIDNHGKKTDFLRIIPE